MSELKKEIELLRKVEKVDTPPFLFTRIESKIADLESGNSKVSKWTLSSFALVVIINLSVGYSYMSNSNSNSQINSYVESFNTVSYE